MTFMSVHKTTGYLIYVKKKNNYELLRGGFQGDQEYTLVMGEWILDNKILVYLDCQGD